MLLIGERYRDKLSKPLELRGEQVLWLPDNPDLPPPLRGHADLSVCAIENTIIAAKSVYTYIDNNLTNNEFNVLSGEPQNGEYKNHVGLCVCQTGRYDLYNPKTTDKAVFARLTGVPITVRQGYTRCSVCVVSENAIITSDAGIAAAAERFALDVLMITPGYISLDGYDYGFIGGAAFPLNSHAIAFTGTFDTHPDKNEILRFLKKYGKMPVFLTKAPIFDIGSAMSLP